ncbi:hypothetical protein A3Q40_00001 [Rhodococcus sp. PBTS 1]|nr:hypothetical protein A3Q40_00001 [Rhodococcus sp. PBTS 1]
MSLRAGDGLRLGHAVGRTQSGGVEDGGVAGAVGVEHGAPGVVDHVARLLAGNTVSVSSGVSAVPAAVSSTWNPALVVTMT